MANPSLYPKSPSQVPPSLVTPTAKYKNQAWLAFTALLSFIIFYLALMCAFGYLTIDAFRSIADGKPPFHTILVFASALLLTIFMGKSLFVVSRAAKPDGIEVTADVEPELFQFLHTLADEVGAPKPHRVYITPDVNAAVFYDLSLLNLFFPSKKNLIIGLGLVNVLNLGELKAVLAHEFGHFSQKSMMVGRWVYIAQQIVARMVATRDWLDTLIRFVSRVDLRVAWIGWLLGLILWSVRSLMDTLFGLVVMVERALSREMEFNADLVAVSVTGSDALIDALHKLQAADHAWQVAVDEVGRQAGQQAVIDDFFVAQQAVIEQMRRVLDDPQYGAVIEKPAGSKHQHRTFDEQMALPPQMWATHPQNRDREENAKANYIEADIDQRSAWLLFAEPVQLKARISKNFYIAEKVSEFDSVSAVDAVERRFDKPSYAPRYRGAYLNRDTMRNFESIDQLLSEGQLADSPKASIAQLYPTQMSDDLKTAEELNSEREILLALQRGELKPSGGVIRHRSEVINKKDIPEVVEQVDLERKAITDKLRFHDASIRRSHLQAAESVGNGWAEYLMGLNRLLHCTEHMRGRIEDELALLVNTWQVITADGTVGFFEKRRILKVSTRFQAFMQQISQLTEQLELPEVVAQALDVQNWAEQCPQFDLTEVDKSNWSQWCPAAMDYAQHFINALGAVASQTQENLITTEHDITLALDNENHLTMAPRSVACPDNYPLLVPGNEHQLQLKLDLWNRFQLAQGLLPSTARLMISVGIVGGTLFFGFMS